MKKILELLKYFFRLFIENFRPADKKKDSEKMESKEDLIKKVASRLNIKNWKWLYNLINFETAGTFSPTIKNPYSSARGLIQFIDSTAQDMGFKDSLHLVNTYPDFKSQLEGPVYEYLKDRGPYPTEQSLYMAVFSPYYQKLPSYTEFPLHVQKVNPGIKTVKDYVNKVNNQKGALKTDTGILLFAVIMGTGYLMFS